MEGRLIILPWAVRKRRQRRQGMRQGKKLVIGCDVSAGFIILHDGKNALRIEDPKELPDLKNAVFVLEQTGAYGIRWAQIFSNFGEVYIADGRDFKNFRLAHTRQKNDSLDAFYLREYFLQRPQKCRPFNPQIVYIRALIRQHIRNQKDITMHTNRLLQYLQMIDPYAPRPSRYKLHRYLDQIENRIKELPHALTDLALSEIKKLKACLEEAQKVRQEIENIARNHPDYEILRTFPLSDLQVAVILAYSWDINNFSNKDGYIAYTLMGTTLEQSGKSLYKVKTDKARTEIKGLLYTLYLNANKEKHPLKPLSDLAKELASDRNNYKKRYIKFLSRLLELVYYARKERTDYRTTLQNAITRRERELSYTQQKELNPTRAKKLYHLTRSIKTLKELLARCEDISSWDSQSPQEPQAYLVPEQNQKEDSHEEPNSPNLNLSPNLSPNKSPRQRRKSQQDRQDRGNTPDAGMQKRKVGDNLRQERGSNQADPSGQTTGKAMYN
jgi:transposase